MWCFYKYSQSEGHAHAVESLCSLCLRICVVVFILPAQTSSLLILVVKMAEEVAKVAEEVAAKVITVYHALAYGFR